MPAASSSWTNGSSVAARAAPRSTGRRRRRAAREMLTPLPPACEVTDSARITAPRSSRPREGDGAVVARVGGEGDDHATTTSRPARLERAGGASAAMPLVGDERRRPRRASANRIGASTPILLESARQTTRRAAPTMARLVAASSRSGVESPWSMRQAVGAEEGDVGAQPAERGDGVGADRGLGGRPHPAGEQVQLDLGAAREPGGDRHGVGDDREPQVAGEQAGRTGRSSSRRRGAPCRPAGGSRSRAALAIRSFSAVLAWSRSPSPASITASAARGHGAAVHPADQAHPLEDRQVAADRLGRDVELLGDLGHREPAALGDELGHRLLALFGVHCQIESPPPSVNLCMCCFTPECVDCQGVRRFTRDHGHQHCRTPPLPTPRAARPSCPGSPTDPPPSCAPRCRRRRSRASTARRTPTPDAALAAYDAAAQAVADGFVRKAARPPAPPPRC